MHVIRDWLVLRRAGVFEGVRAGDGAHLKVRSDGLSAAGSPSVPSALSALAPLDPIAADLVAAISLGPIVSDRAGLLRGTGWSRLFVELTDRCNERCVHCYASSAPELSTTLDWPTLRSTIGDAARLGFDAIQFTGGDPLLSPHCIDAVREARARGIREVEIYTNGLALTGMLWEALRELRPSLTFSFHSHDPDVHDAITMTAGSHVRTSRAIRNATAAGLRVRVGMVLTGPNDEHEASTRAFLGELGVRGDAISCDVTRAVGRGIQLRARGADRAASVVGPSPTNIGHRRTVGALAGTAAIAANGDVHVCVFSRHRSLGNVASRSLTEILAATGELRWEGDGMSLISALTRASGRLACGECQVRDVLLDAAGVG